MPNQATEAQFEDKTITRLTQLGYHYQHGSTIARPLHTVVLEERLRVALHQRYPEQASAALDLAVQTITSPAGVTLEQRTMAFQRLLREGFDLPYEAADEQHFVHSCLPFRAGNPPASAVGGTPPGFSAL
jgi:hypothetical protein